MDALAADVHERSLIIKQAIGCLIVRVLKGGKGFGEVFRNLGIGYAIMPPQGYRPSMCLD